MQTIVIQMNTDDCYFYDPVTNERVYKYDPNKEINACITLKKDGSRIYIDSSNINVEYGGYIVVNYHNIYKFILDDGFDTNLIRSGYIVYKNFDSGEDHITDPIKGCKLRGKIVKKVREIIPGIYNKFYPDAPMGEIYKGLDYDGDRIVIDDGLYEKYNNNTSFKIITDDYEYLIQIVSIPTIVNKNKTRRDNSLPYYPFIRSMDKYGTLYLNIYATKRRNETSENKYRTADDMIVALMNMMGSDFHFISNFIKQRILYYTGI